MPWFPLPTPQRVRDKLRSDNIDLKNKCGLVGNTRLLRDYESRYDESGLLEQQLEVPVPLLPVGGGRRRRLTPSGCWCTDWQQLKTRYAELSLQVKGYKSKLERVAGPTGLASTA